jgi:hypothetical protein
MIMNNKITSQLSVLLINDFSRLQNYLLIATYFMEKVTRVAFKSELSDIVSEISFTAEK